MTSKRAPIIGIDLGTTYSLAAVMQGTRPVILPNALGELLTPSAVSRGRDGALLVGAPARARATTHPSDTVLAFKRDMGTSRHYELGDQVLSPQMLSALVLGALKRDAEVALGVEITEAVVTVPAYFGDLQRQATRDAGALAGLVVERIVNEPTAAALAYGLHNRGRELKVAVLDLGGGTFDVTILEIIDGVIEIRASAGDARLGGDDFDAAIAQEIALRVERTRGTDLRQDPVAWARLVAASEQAKRRLSTEHVTRVVLPEVSIRGRTFSVDEPLERGDAEASWGDLLQRVRGPIARALRDAALPVSEIDEVLLVGGSTRMPAIAALAAQTFGRLPLRTLPPDEAVALGAAVQAALKEGHAAVEDLVVTDVAPFTLGISSAVPFGRALAHDMFAPLIERGTTIPCSRVKRFHPLADGQTHIHVEVYQGEHAEVAKNQHLGSYHLTSLPPGRPAEANGVDIRFTYDLNGILEVEMTVAATGNVESFVLEERPGALDAAGLEAARAAMARLKIHPRDALPNATALARADALYVELAGAPREALSLAIAAFRVALEAQRPSDIEAARAQLVALTARLREGA